MPKRNYTETLLTHVVGSARAKAIVGDLLELAAAKGQLWYYANSLTTVLSFYWRNPVGFVLGGCSLLAMHFLFAAMAGPNLFLAWESHAYATEVLMRAVCALAFLTPLIAVKYGVQGELFTLSFASLLVSGLVYFAFDMSRMVLALTCLGLLAVTGLLKSVQWRRPTLILLGAVAVGTLADLNLGNFAHLGCWLYARKPLTEASHYHYFELGYAFPRTIFWTVSWAIALFDMLVLCIACSKFHRVLMPRSQEAKLA